VVYSRSKACPKGFQEVEAFRFQDNQQMKVVRLSDLRTGRLYPLRNIAGTYFCQKLTRPQGHRITPSGIEPTTSRLVSQCLTNCATTCSRIREVRCSNLVQTKRHHWPNMSITTVDRNVPGVNPDMKTGCSDRFYVFNLSLSTHIRTLRRVPAKGHDFSVDIKIHHSL
jgi:hypothetical protein